MEKEFSDVKKFLSSHNIDYEVSSHAPVHTSKEAALVRDVDEKTGAKAIVLKSTINNFYMAVLPGNKKMDLKKLAEITNEEKLRLAPHEEVLQRTGCEIGSVHPLGNMFDLKTYCDSSLLDNEYIYFNPGVHDKSIKMKPEDYIKCVNPVICEFVK